MRLFALIIVLLSLSCTAQHEQVTLIKSYEQFAKDKPVESMDQKIDSVEVPFDRESILHHLTAKIKNNEPLVVHVFVPLCDNEHQGIVPTSPSIGNGFDAHSNLYWGTSKGMKRFFKELKDWNLLEEKEHPLEFVLDRAVFEKTYTNGASVKLVMDAYRGDKMKLCLNDYFSSLSGSKNGSIDLGNDSISIYSGADLIIFNGHNGLMDEFVEHQDNLYSSQKDAVAIACISRDYFKSYWKSSKSYPLVTTTGLMYPGAFCTEYIINEWAMLKSAEQIRKAAGRAYYKYKPKSGPNGSNNLFDTNW